MLTNPLGTAPSNFPDTQVTLIMRAGVGDVVSGTSGAFTVTTFYPKLSDFTNYSNYVGVFDEFRIEEFSIDFFPKYNVLDFQTEITNTGLQIPRVYMFTDRNGNFTTSTESIFLTNNTGFRFIQDPLKHWKYTVKAPRFQLNATTSVGTANGISSTGFVDTTNYNTLHYGCAIGISGSGNSTLTWDWAYITSCKVTFRRVT